MGMQTKARMQRSGEDAVQAADKVPEPADVADAIAIAWTAAMRVGSKRPMV